MKKLIIAAATLSISIGFASLHLAKTSSPAAPPPSYVLRAWRIDGGAENDYLWSLEPRSQESSTGTLYRSLASEALRARISKLAEGTKLTLNWARSGVLDDAESWRRWNHEFDDFTVFCKSKKINFTYGIITD